MPAHRLKGPMAEPLLKACARLTPARGLENRLADPETPSLQAEQIDAADRQVTAQVLRHDGIFRRPVQKRADHSQMFPLNQRDLTGI